MKKIMIYSKHTGAGFPKASGERKNFGDTVMFYCFFLCGELIGSGLFLSEKRPENVFAAVSSVLLSNTAEKSCLMLLIASVFAFMICMIAALSCAGITLLAGIPFLQGALYSLLAADLITSQGAQGLFFFSLIILPGAMVAVTAAIDYCTYSAVCSKSVAKTVFFGSKENLNTKQFIQKNAFYLLIMLGSVGIFYICVKVFGSLF